MHDETQSKCEMSYSLQKNQSVARNRRELNGEDFSCTQLFQSVNEAVGVLIRLPLQGSEVVIRFEGDHLPDIAAPL